MPQFPERSVAMTGLVWFGLESEGSLGKGSWTISSSSGEALTGRVAVGVCVEGRAVEIHKSSWLGLGSCRKCLRAGAHTAALGQKSVVLWLPVPPAEVWAWRTASHDQQMQGNKLYESRKIVRVEIGCYQFNRKYCFVTFSCISCSISLFIFDFWPFG